MHNVELRVQRALKDISAKSLAAKVNITTAYMSRIENGLVPGPATRRKIASVLGAPIKSLWRAAKKK